MGRRRGARERCWDRALSAALLSDGTRGVVRPLPQQREDARWRGEIARIHGGWQLQGRCCLQLQRECSRCLSPFWWSLQVEIAREFLSNGDNEDPLVSADGEVDLIDVLREEVWLSWQQFVSCGTDCQGVDGQGNGGAKENVDVDNPFAALAQIKFSKD